MLTYEKDFGDHHIDVLLGHEVKSDKLTYLMAMKEQFLIPNNPELSNGASLKMQLLILINIIWKVSFRVCNMIIEIVII